MEKNGKEKNTLAPFRVGVSMFYGAHPLIFRKAEELRNNPTPAEAHLWNNIGYGQLGIKFRRQHPASIYVLDFYAHKLKLAIEIDGTIHTLENVKQNDEQRKKFLESFGITFIRFTNEQVMTDINSVLEIIKLKIEKLNSGQSKT